MRVTQLELGIVALLIGYIAFYTHPVPKHLQDFLSSPVGTVIALLGILGVTVYRSLLVGVFLAIAFVMSVGGVTEYLDPKEQTPEPPAQPTSTGVSPPEVTGALNALLKNTNKPSFKGDTRLPQVGQKKGTEPPKPPMTQKAPAGKMASSTEHFASF